MLTQYFVYKVTIYKGIHSNLKNYLNTGLLYYDEKLVLLFYVTTYAQKIKHTILVAMVYNKIQLFYIQ